MNKGSPSPKNELQAVFPANSLQQGFIYHTLSQPLDDAYRVQTLCDYKHAIDLVLYRQAWALAIETYPSLRTCFNWEEQPLQLVIKQGQLHFRTEDISAETDQDAAILKIQQADRLIGFDLTKPTLLRLCLIKQSDTQFTLLKTEHHSIADAWSAAILLNQVHHYYEQLVAGVVPVVILDNAYLHAQAYIAKNQAAAQQHWQAAIAQVQQVNDVNPLFSTQADLAQLKTVTLACELNLTVAQAAYQALLRVAQVEGLTPHSLVQFAWHKLLQIYTQDLQTIVGTTISGRAIPIAGIEASVGLYINTLPLIINWNNDHSIK
ncbi:MAG: condensation domain-containing protein, partial [Legionellales bacterium]